MHSQNDGKSPSSASGPGRAAAPGVNRRTLAAAALLTTALSLLAPSALAHSVPGDADPGRALYVMPGLVMDTGFRGCCLDEREGGFLDIGVEVSAFKFVPSSQPIIFQPGYGGLAQAQIAGIPFNDHPSPKEPGTHARLAVGGEATFGLIGAQAGVMTRLGSPTYGSAVGPFAGVFVSIGIISAGIQIDAPVVSSGDARMPLFVTMPITAKFPIAIEPKR